MYEDDINKNRVFGTFAKSEDLEPANKVRDFYKCHMCGGTKFCHDVSIVYEEVFDSEEKIVVQGKHYNEGEDWVCQNCNVGMPKANVDEFISQMCDAEIEDR